MRKVLILGGNGFLGRNLVQYLGKHLEVSSTMSKKVSVPSGNYFIINTLTQFKELEKIVPNFAVVINCVGLANVLECEKNPELAYYLNALIPKKLVKLTDQYGIQLVHISTDHFETKKDCERDERVACVPTNVYSFTKLRGESFLTNSKNAIILRTNFFGRDYLGNNSLLDFALKKFLSNQSILGFTNIYFNPISISLLSNIIKISIERRLFGVFNLGANQCISKFQFLKLVAENFQLDSTLVQPEVYSKEKYGVERPNNMCLNTKKFHEFFGIPVPSIGDMLSSYKSNY